MTPATHTWTGGGANANWSTAANWDIGVPNGDDFLIFPANALQKTNTNNLSAGIDIHGITFSGGGYTLNGANSIDLDDGTSGIFSQPSNETNTINFRIRITADDVAISSSATSGYHALVLNGDIDLNDHPVDLEGTGAMQINGEIDGGGTGGVLIRNDGGTTYLAHSNPNLTGDFNAPDAITINQGIIVAEVDGALGGGVGGSTAAGSRPNVRVFDATGVGGAIAFQSGLTYNSGLVLRLQGDGIAGQGALMASLGVSLGANVQLDLDDATTINSYGDLTINGEIDLDYQLTTVAENGDMTLNGQLNNWDSDTGANGGLNVSMGRLIVTAAGNVFTGASTVGSGTTLVWNGTTTTAGTTTVTNGGTLAGTGTITAVTVNSGGTVSPGNPLTGTGVGTLTATQANFSAGGTLRLQIRGNTVSSTFDRLVLTGAGTNTLTVGGTSNLFLDLSGITSTGAGTLVANNIVTYEARSPAAGTFTNVTRSPVSFSVSTTYNAADLDISIGNVGATAATGIGEASGLSDIGLDSAQNASAAAQAVVIASLDTGVDYTHPLLVNNIWINQAEIPADILARLKDLNKNGIIDFADLNSASNQGNGKVKDVNRNGLIDPGDLLASRSNGGWSDGLDQGGNGYVDDIVGWNFVANNNNPFDDNGHGTFQAGLLTSVNSKALVMALKVLDQNGAGGFAEVVAGMDYAVKNHAQVISNAWAATSVSPELLGEIMDADAAGVLVVLSAGNGDPAVLDALAAYDLDNVLIVAASDSDQPVYPSTPGLVDLIAPGVDIVSTTMGGGKGVSSGSSVSTALVAGSAGLVFGLNPGLNADGVKQALLDGAKPVASSDLVADGLRLDVLGALKAAGVAPRSPAPTSSPAPSKAARNFEALAHAWAALMTSHLHGFHWSGRFRA